MLSDFDRSNIDTILAGDGDWFTAELLRYIGTLPYDDRTAWSAGFPDEVAAVGGRRTTGRVCSLSYLLAKADDDHLAQINQCLAAQLIPRAMTYEKLVQHVASRLPSHIGFDVKRSQQREINQSEIEQWFTVWINRGLGGGFQIVATLQPTSFDAAVAFDAWLAEQDFTGPFDGVEMQLQEAHA